jgi:hypothetical protein
MPLKKDARPLESLDEEEFDDLVDAELDDHDTIRQVLQEASARGYSADGVSPVLDRFLHRALDSVLADYKELFDLFFDGTALEYFVDDARTYLDGLVSEGTDVAEQDEPESDEEEFQDPRRGSAAMPTMRFPVSEYYADHVLEGITLSNKGGWWSAVLLIRDPKTKKPFLALYRWERKDGTWRNRKSFVIRDQSSVAKVIAALNELKAKLPQA